MENKPLPQSPASDSPGPWVLRKRELVTLTRISRSKVGYLLDPKSRYHDPTFPRPIRLGGGGRGSVGWLAEEVLAWLRSRERLA